MCPCNPDNGEFVYVLLAAAAVLVGIHLMRQHWSRMGPGLRAGGILAIALLIGLLGYLVWPARSSSPPGSGDLVIETGGLPTLVDLGAGICIPCKLMEPILDGLKDEYAGRMNVQCIDVWENRDVATPYRVRTIPTQIFFDASGRELYRHEGFYSKEDILAKWQDLGIPLVATATTRPTIDASAAPKTEQQDDPDNPVPPLPRTDPGEATQTAIAPVDNFGLATDPEWKVIAYYFHRTMRCYACQTIETLSKQVIEQEFAGEIASGLLEYRAINIDTPENSHFEDDFELTVQALVLVRIENGQFMEWKNLERIWELFEDIGAFAAYIQEEVNDHLYPDTRAADVPASAD